METSSIVLTDLPERVAGGLADARGVGEGWIPVTFETEELSGTGLATGAHSGAGEMALDLGLEGRHTLHFALGAKTSLRVWLEGDRGYREFSTEHGGYAAQECALHAADLTGRRLHIAPKSGPEARGASLFYIRAVPTSEEYSSRRNLVATNDGWSWVALDGIDSERDVWRFFEPLRESDFGLMLWGPGGADFSACHNTQVGTVAPLQPTHAFRECDRNHALSLEKLLEGGGDILQSAVAAARDVGVRIHFYIRPEAFFAPFPIEGFTSRIFAQHPEWRCRDEFGDEVMRLSYALPQVQDHMIEYFEELIEYSPDGLCFAFNRSLPMMIAEEPVLQEFERQNGRRPNLPDEIDGEGMIAARTNLMNGFLQRVRDLLTERGLEFSCIVPPNETENRTYGLALDELVRRGVFDEVMIHNGGFHANAANILDSPFWTKLQKLGNARVYPNGWGGSYDHAEAARFLQENALSEHFSGGFFWDTENLSTNPYNWHVVRRGGNVEFLDGVIAGRVPSPRVVPFTRLQGVKLGRYNPGRSY